MAKTVSLGNQRMPIKPEVSDKLESLKLAYQKKHSVNINIKTIAERLVMKAKLKDIE